MRAFITGATGIVGSHILIELLKANRQVNILVREKSNRNVITKALDYHNLSGANIKYVLGDIGDPIALREGMKDCQEVYHCAATVSFDPLLTNYLIHVNAGGTANVVNACLALGIERLCYISSTAAIGDVKIDGFYTEQSTWTSDKGRSGYSLSKHYAELEVWRAREEGLKALIVNPALVVGAGNWGESSTTILLSCENGMKIYPSGSNGFVSASDVARFCLEGMDKGWFTDRFLLVSENLSFKDFFTKATKAFGSTQPKILLPRWLARIGRSILRVFEIMRINMFSITSQNIDSAYNQSKYSNAMARSKGFEFTPIDVGIDTFVKRYRAEK